ncbi:MAG: CYTH domain-containing protein [Candidatus Colwellbacteria bacterium]|nr:CYTH domain-containing protein [Candidatus Colwellbacteria bacterium]
MAQEKEIKINLTIPLDDFIARITSRGFEKISETVQRDNYFDTDDWLLYKNVASLRIRQVDGKDHSFAFKKVFCVPIRSDSHYVEEIEGRIPCNEGTKENLNLIFDRVGINDDPRSVSDGKSLEDVFIRNGFQGEQILSKTRILFNDGKGNEIMIDDVQNVGTIVELECAEKEPMDAVNDLLEDAEWERGKLGTGYIWLERVKGFTDHLGHEQKFKTDPAWNVWENEVEIYNRLSSEK